LVCEKRKWKSHEAGAIGKAADDEASSANGLWFAAKNISREKKKIREKRKVTNSFMGKIVRKGGMAVR